MTKNMSKQRGSVIVLAMLVTLLILGLGLTAMWMSTSGTKLTSNLQRRQEAMYSAEAGIERARAILDATPDWSTLLAGCVTGEVRGSYGVRLCDGLTPLENSRMVPSGLSQGSAMSNLTFTVFIRNDQAEIDNNPTTGQVTDINRRVVLRAEGLGRDGLSYFAIETVVNASAPVATESSYNQIGGNAQGTNSTAGNIALPTGGP